MSVIVMSVKGVEDMFKMLRKKELITGRTKVYLSSDGEGNSFAPLATINGSFNVAVEKDKSMITLYPVHV